VLVWQGREEKGKEGREYNACNSSKSWPNVNTYWQTGMLADDLCIR